jgi:hypothetical protein
MGLGIVVLLIGIPIGLLMLFKPRQVWWFTEAWKFRNPEANEPSGAVYVLSGLGCIAATLILAALAFTKPDDSAASSYTSTTTRTTYPSHSYTLPPPTAFMPPPVMARGSLDMIGYLTSPGPDGGLVATVYFWAPEVTSRVPEDDPTAPPPCELAPRVTGAGTDHVVVDVDLVWTPNTSKSVLMNGDCRADGGKHPVRRSYVVGPVSSSARLFTSKPDADTPLPRLAEPPGPLSDPVPPPPR